MTRSAGMSLLACIALAAQDRPAKPQFELAAVKPVPVNEIAIKRAAILDLMPQNMVMERRGLSVTLRGKTLLSLISTAYRVKTTQVTGPSWLSDEAFDVEARIPEGANPELANEMLQSLLEERFGLQVHHETKEVPGYELVVAKNGPKLKESENDPSAPNKMTPDEMLANAQAKVQKAAKTSGNRRSAHGISSAELANIISQMAQAPVVDKTGLTGHYDVVLETSPDTPNDPGRTIFQAVGDLGLKLEVHKVLVEKVVVDKVNKTPTDN